MLKRAVLNLVLLVVVAVGGGLLYFEPWAGAPKQEPRLTDLDKAKVDRVEIVRAGKKSETTVLTRTESGWRVTKPFDVRADSARVGGLMDALRQRSKDHFAVTDRNLEKFGLAKPSVRVMAGDAKIEIGDKVPTQRALYVRVGDRIYTADTNLRRTADRAPEAFASRSLLPDEPEITQIDGRSFEVRRQTGEGSGWTVVASAKSTAKDAADRIANAWKTAFATRVEPRQSTRDPKVDVRVSLKGRDRPLQFARLKPLKNGDVPVTRPDFPLRYVVDKATAERLFALQEKSDKSAKDDKAKDASSQES